MSDKKNQISIYDLLNTEDLQGLSGSSVRTKTRKDDYDGFVEKFKPKLTTDDCCTPDIVYNAIADYVAERYGLNKSRFVRPFWPGGDYEAYPYEPGDVVVDNPPFSILKKIQEHYTSRGVKFFLFAPSLTLFSANQHSVCYIPIDASITYENGAVVNTAFITNLEPEDVIIQILPDLQAVVEQANKENTKRDKVTLPKYSYPTEVITAAMCHKFANNGITLTIRRSEAHFLRALDNQRIMGKTIFGGGFLLSEKAAAEKAAAEKAAAKKAAAEKAAAEKAAAEKAGAHIWVLSAREREIIKRLGDKTV